MESQEILKLFLQKGILIDREILNLFSETEDLEALKIIVDTIKNHTQKKVITRTLFEDNKEQISQILSSLPKERQLTVEKLKINLGLSIEVSKEIENTPESDLEKKEEKDLGVKITSMPVNHNKKLEVGDFTKYFRGRYEEVKDLLQTHPELSNLISINKLSGVKQNLSLIGIVSDKKITKNKNIIFEIEDLTGKTRLLVSQNKQELYEKAEEISLDSVLGFRCSGNREILFVNDIIFPEAMISVRKNSPVEEYALFLGDMHFGSKKFLKENFLKFIDYLNGKVPDTPEVEKIKYLFFVGDIVTGVGNYPNQEADLEIPDLEAQFSELAALLGKINKNIQIIISPGNHDGVRIMEPQPILNEKYAWPLFNLKNVILTSNPAYVNIGAKKGFEGFNVLTYHGFSFPFYANVIPKLIVKKAMNCPEEIMKYLLKQRHLAPTHASIQYFPFEKDPLLIRNVPDIFVSAHTHKSAVTYYNNILVISISCWESLTPYQEKFGNEPDHCKVPMLNLKTRAIKILDFE